MNGYDRYVFGNVLSSVAETDTVIEYVGRGVDMLDFRTLHSAVTVDLRSDTALAVHFQRTVVTGAAGQAAHFESAAGGTGNDTLTGNDAANWLGGSVGDDILIGSWGNDTLVGGDGNDTLTGGDGSDKLIGGNGNDFYVFGRVAGNINETDTITELLNEGVDALDFRGLTAGVIVDLSSDTALGSHNLREIVSGGAGQAVNLENALGGAGNDTLIGNGRANVLIGNAGKDLLVGHGGNDKLYGGGNADILIGGAGDDRLVGGSGDDHYLFEDVPGAASETDRIEELAGGGRDSINFAALTAGVNVNLGVHWVIASHAKRRIMTAAAGQGANLEVIAGGSADDILTGNAADNWIGGNGGNDILSGGPGNDTLIGGDGDDTLDGGAGNDRLAGGNGNDLLKGGSGDDVYWFRPVTSGSPETDTITEFAGKGTDTLDFGGLETGVTIDLTQETVAIHDLRSVKVSAAAQSAHLESVIGGSAGDNIIGNNAANVLVGNGGNDTLLGGRGRDLLIGGLGSDTIRGSSGQDILIAGGLNFQNNAAGLNAIRNEWLQPTALQTRIDHLMGLAGGLNGEYTINSATVVDDVDADSLFGEGDLDWFWADTGEVKDFAAGERRDP